jgi:hypothetical protein
MFNTSIIVLTFATQQDESPYQTETNGTEKQIACDQLNWPSLLADIILKQCRTSHKVQTLYCAMLNICGQWQLIHGNWCTYF